MFKNNLKSFMTLNKLHEQEKQFKRELSKTFLGYLDSLPPDKRIEQMESLLYETEQRNLPMLDRRLTFQEGKCLHLASQGKEVKEAANILGLSQRTIKFHRANIIKKLDVPNLMAAIGAGNQYCNTDKDEFYDTILNIMDCNVYWKNKDGYYLWCNKKMQKFVDLRIQITL
jgi:DNA-binding CsgD family transcriptional regulator